MKKNRIRKPLFKSSERSLSAVLLDTLKISKYSEFVMELCFFKYTLMPESDDELEKSHHFHLLQKQVLEDHVQFKHLSDLLYHAPMYQYGHNGKRHWLCVNAFSNASLIAFSG